jgi:hypothetical protein
MTERVNTQPGFCDKTLHCGCTTETGCVDENRRMNAERYAEEEARDFIRRFPDDVPGAYVALQIMVVRLQGQRDRLAAMLELGQGPCCDGWPECSHTLALVSLPVRSKK